MSRQPALPFPRVQPDEADSPPADHLHAGYRDFGLKGMTRALCSCGYATPALTGSDAALRRLLDEHGARLPRPGERAGVPY